MEIKRVRFVLALFLFDKICYNYTKQYGIKEGNMDNYTVVLVDDEEEVIQMIMKKGIEEIPFENEKYVYLSYKKVTKEQ